MTHAWIRLHAGQATCPQQCQAFKGHRSIKQHAMAHLQHVGACMSYGMYMEASGGLLSHAATHQTLIRSHLSGCSGFIKPSSSTAFTSTTVSAHWKHNSALGAVKPNPARAYLFNSVKQPLDSA